VAYDRSDPIRSDPIIVLALEILERRAFEPLFRLADLATAVGRSEWSVSSRLKKTTGRNLCQHLHDRRIRHSKLLLSSSGLSIKEIAAAVGYLRTSDFDREFHRRTGNTPKEWRSANRTCSNKRSGAIDQQ
jgi:AraC-like DNA-binding protein